MLYPLSYEGWWVDDGTYRHSMSGGGSPGA